jgi:hypothetical protein
VCNFDAPPASEIVIKVKLFLQLEGLEACVGLTTASSWTAVGACEKGVKGTEKLENKTGQDTKRAKKTFSSRVCVENCATRRGGRKSSGSKGFIYTAYSMAHKNTRFRMKTFTKQALETSSLGCCCCLSRKVISL